MSFHNNNFIFRVYSKIITSILPIKQEEVSQYSLISIMLFCFLFIQNLARNLKDTLSVNMIGAEANNLYKLTFIPVFVILIMYCYTKAVSRFSNQQIFYFVLSLFLVWFVLFGFLIFPYREYFTMSPGAIEGHSQAYPHFKWFIKVFGNWSLGLFYVSVEFWQSLVIMILSWQFIMNILTVEQSRRMFLSFSLISQSGLIFSGFCMVHTSDIFNFIGLGLNVENLVKSYIILIFLFGVCGVYIFYLLNELYSQSADITNAEQLKINKKHPGFIESVMLVLRSRYMILITIIIFAYGSSINLVESKWKDILRHTSKNEFIYFQTQADLLIYQGVITVLFGWFGANLVRFGWTRIAIIPALFSLFIGGMYFSAMIFSLEKEKIFYIGSYYMIFIKAGKYIFLDNTKELVFKILPVEVRTKGKGSIDLIANKYGKAFSSLMLTVLFMMGYDLSGSEINIYIASIFFFIIISWVIAVLILGKLYNKKLHSAIEK